MKKLSLEMLRLSTDEVLERSQMKKITGGYGGGVGCLDMKCGRSIQAMFAAHKPLVMILQAVFVS